MERAQEIIGRLFAAIRDFRNSSRQTFNLVAGAIALGAVLSLAFYLFNPAAPVVLASSLAPADHTAIALRLRRAGIHFTLGPDSILVPSWQLHEAERVLQGSPGFTGGTEDFSLFDRPAMGQSDFDEQVNYQRSLQGEIERTIMNISGIENARVMLAMGRPSPFALGPSEATRASVMLTTVLGAMIDPVMARAIAHLVAGSVRGLQVENVTVTTNDGAIIYPVQHEGELGEAIQLRNDYEHSLEEKASSLLNRIMGRNRFAVEVSVDVDNSRVTSKQETFNGQAVLSEEHSVTPSGASLAAAGIPGLTSNLPVPSAAATPQAEASLAAAAHKGASGGASTQQSQAARKDIVNYKPSSHVVDTVTAPARVSRISIAAVLDGTYEGGQFRPLPKERLDAIRGLLVAAVGAQPDRGDSIQVQSAALSQPYIPPVPNPVAQIRSLLSDPIYFYGAIGVGLILLILLLWLGARAARRMFARTPAEIAAAPASRPAGEPASTFVLTPELETSKHAATPEGAPAQKSYEQLRVLINQKAGREPEAVAEILRQWIETANGANGNGNGNGTEALTP